MQVVGARVEAGTHFAGEVVAYGHWGRPFLVFPAEAGRAGDIAEHGLLDAVRFLVDGGRAKLYCVDTADAGTWSDRTLPIEERARRHEDYERWLLDGVLPWIAADCGGAPEVAAVGVSLGAFHAVNLALRHADRVPLALGLSGNYDPPSWQGFGERGDATYFNSPIAYVPGLSGDHLAWLRTRLSVVLVVGQGAFEVSPTQALPSTQRLAGLLQDKGLRCELDVWGEDVPHDWSSWARQLAHHLPRLC